VKRLGRGVKAPKLRHGDESSKLGQVEIHADDTIIPRQLCD
jgi:hypothetical protein